MSIYVAVYVAVIFTLMALIIYNLAQHIQNQKDIIDSQQKQLRRTGVLRAKLRTRKAVKIPLTQDKDFTFDE